jgi:hypothetical protein
MEEKKAKISKPVFRKLAVILVIAVGVLAIGLIVGLAYKNFCMPRKIVDVDGYTFRINFGASLKNEVLGSAIETKEQVNGYHINFYAVDREEAVVNLRKKLITEPGGEVTPQLLTFINEHSHNKGFSAPKGKSAEADKCDHFNIIPMSLLITTHNPTGSENPCPDDMEYEGSRCDDCNSWIALTYRGFARARMCSGEEPFCKEDYENMTW